MSSEGLKIDVRRAKILADLGAEGRVFVADLSNKLEVSNVTIRNDLNALEKRGYLKRIQGGAISTSQVTETAPPIVCDNEAEKQAIAKLILGHISDGSTLFINSGTTTNIIASSLKEKKNLNIVTNSFNIAESLCGNQNNHVTLLGGEIEIGTNQRFTYGNDAILQLSRYKAEYAILSIDGISHDAGISSYFSNEAMIDLAMINNSRNLFIAADYSKVGHQGFVHITELSDRVHLFTDSKCDKNALSLIKSTGAKVYVA